MNGMVRHVQMECGPRVQRVVKKDVMEFDLEAHKVLHNRSVKKSNV